MNRRVTFVLSVLSLVSSAGAAYADQGPVYDVAKCRPWRSRSCYRTYPVHYSRPSVSATAIRQTVISNSFNNNYGRPAFGAVGSVASAHAYGSSSFAVARSGAFSLGVRNPLYETPVDGPALVPGKQYTFKVSYLLEVPGYVNLYVGHTSVSCPVIKWSPNEVTFELPNMGVAETGTLAQIEVARPDGYRALLQVVSLVNGPTIIEHDEPETSGSQVGMMPYAGPVVPIGS